MTNSTTDSISATTSVAPPKDDAERTKALAKAYQAANTALREAHRDEFNGLYTAQAKRLGQTWAPRPNAQEKARADLLRLLDENPELAEEVAKRLTK